MGSRSKRILSSAAPVVASYIPLGLACGVLGAKCGITPVRSLILSFTTFTGGGQFMICNLWLAGLPVTTIVLSCAAIALRFALYSASLAPYLKGASKRAALALSATLIEEAYGITLARLSSKDESWTFRDAFALNVTTISAWALSVATGALLGTFIDVPTAAASFTMTALFIFLLMGQLVSRKCVLAAIVAMLTVAICKLAGAGTVAIPAASVAGVAVALGASIAVDASIQKERIHGDDAA